MRRNEKKKILIAVTLLCTKLFFSAVRQQASLQIWLRREEVAVSISSFTPMIRSGIILLKSRIAIRVIVDNLRRENQLYLWLFVKMFWLYLGVIDSQSSSSAWVLSRASSPRVNKKRVKATLTPLVHLSLAIPASVLVGSCKIFPSNFFNRFCKCNCSGEESEDRVDT